MSTEILPYGAYAPPSFARWALSLTRIMPDTWPGRRVAYALRRLALRSLKGAPVDAEAFGARMRLLPYKNICEKRILFTPQYFDAQERAVLEQRIKSGFVFIDVGANIGGYSLFVASKAGAGACILAIEPQPDIFERLTYNIRLNPFGTIKAIACAIADKAGPLTMFVNPGNSGESSVKIVGTDNANAIRVPAKTLHDIVMEEQLSHIDALKLDVEGAEDLILEPFFKSAPERLYPSLIIMEDGGARWQSDIPQLLTSKGYRLIAQTRINLIFERGEDEEAS